MAVVRSSSRLARVASRARTVAGVERPSDDVVVVRDTAVGVPHVYGSTRSGSEFGAGCATAEDRLCMMDAFRRAGRGQLAGFPSGTPGNRAMDRSVFADAPYSEADLQRQVDRLPQLYRADGRQLIDAATALMAWVNRPTHQPAVEIGGRRAR